MALQLNISDVQLFNLLKAKLGEQEAEQFVGLLKQQTAELVDNKQQIITKDIANLRDDVNKDFKYLRDELYRVFASKEDLARTENKLLLWAFVFWATQLAAMFAFLKFFIRS